MKHRLGHATMFAILAVAAVDLAGCDTTGILSPNAKAELCKIHNSAEMKALCETPEVK